jgi:hypothetical protein
MTKPVTMKARDILALSKDELWALPHSTHLTVVFDDGEVVTTTKRTIYCTYLWNIHRVYPKTPLLTRHHMGMDRISSKVHNTLLETIYRDWYTTYCQDPDYDREACWKLLYETVNEIYNDFTQRIDDHVATLSILDFVQVLDTPAIREANSTVVPTQKSINDTYDSITKSLMDDQALNHNAIAQAVRSSLVDIKQVLQCVGPRGFLTEINSTIWPQPITVGYAQGMRSLYDSMIESRSAAKALMFAKDPLAQCEYFNRKLQLVAQVVETIAPGDCGSQHYMSWKVEPSELKVMAGIHYVENGEVKTISPTDRSLEGQILQLRTPFGCIDPDRQTVCEVCYGQLAHSIPDGTVPGHLAAISIGEKTSQLVLSTKHVDGSSSVDDIDLGEAYAAYLVPGAEDNTLRLSPELKGLPVRIVIREDSAKSLPDIDMLNNLDDINVARITEMSDAKFQIGHDDDEGGMHEITVPVSMGSRLGSLTAEALYYIKDRRYSQADNNDYVIDLTEWDHSLALFELPLKHLNMLDYQDSVESVILSADKKFGLAKFDDPMEAIKYLLALISSKLSINLSHVMTIAYAVSAVDPKNADYRLPRGGEDFKFAPIGELMSNRSMGAMMAYERQESPFTNPETYIIRNRPRHPMDSLLIG